MSLTPKELRTQSMKEYLQSYWITHCSGHNRFQSSYESSECQFVFGISIEYKYQSGLRDSNSSTDKCKGHLKIRWRKRGI